MQKHFIISRLPESIVSFLKHLHRGGAWAYYWTAEGKRSVWWKVGSPASLPKGKVNLYFGIHPTNARRDPNQRARIPDISAINCLFSEFDSKDYGNDKAKARAQIESLVLAPSVIVDSGGGYHCYWLLAESFPLGTGANRDRARNLQARWVTFTGGDKGAKDLARVLRLPGTRNYKPERGPDFPEVKFIHCNFDQLYTLEQFESALPRSSATLPMPPGPEAQSKYGQAAFVDELRKLRSSSNGTRNDQLNRSAFALGQLIGAGALSRSTVESELAQAALQLGLTPAETSATIKSGLDAGALEPRAIPANGKAPTGEKSTAEQDPIRVLIAQAAEAPEGPAKDSVIRSLFESLSTLSPFVLVKYQREVQERLDLSAKLFERMIGEVKRSDDNKAEVIRGVLCYLREPLCNFSANISHELTLQDGQNPARVQLTITGTLANGEPLQTLDVEAAEFESASWVNRWGARPILKCKPSERWLLTRVIKELSQSTLKRETVYTFTGWHTLNNRRAYLTTSGAITADGLDSSVRVDLGDGRMKAYALPNPPDDPREAMRASIAFLDLAPLTVTAPLWAAMYAAPLNDRHSLDAVLWVYGKTQSGKSTIASLALTHFGKVFISGHKFKPPIDWESTVTELESAMFAAKDLPLLIDDYTPQQTKGDSNSQHAKAARVVKSVGNRSYKGRSTANLESRPPRPPRGLVLSTAEEPITGQAVNGRMIYVPVGPGDVQRDSKLDHAQAQAGGTGPGLYSQAMAAYLQTWARDYDRLSLLIESMHTLALQEAREQLSASQPRLSDSFAALLTGAQAGLRFALECGAISQARHNELTDSIQSALLDLLRAQSERVASQSPIIRTAQAMHDQIVQRRATLLRRLAQSTLDERVQLLGWYDPDDLIVYLRTESCIQLARDYWQKSGVNFDVSADSFRRDVANSGLLARRDEGQYERREYMGGVWKNERVLVVDAMKFATLTGYAFHPSQEPETDSEEIS